VFHRNARLILRNRIMSEDFILIEGARQNNLKDISLRIPLKQLVVVTGVSGSGKSSLAFDTIYSEGQRRYVETFSPYARQFLDRMDKPNVDRIDGIPPAIAIDQTNPVRTSRSTVGTMTELNDHVKLLFARAARLHCRGCGKSVTRDSPNVIHQRVFDMWGKVPPADRQRRRHGKRRNAGNVEILITFSVPIPKNFTEKEVRAVLTRQGYRKILRKHGGVLEVIQDRVRVLAKNNGRIAEDLETALTHGHGRLTVYRLTSRGSPGAPLSFSANLHCPGCNIRYRDPAPSLFSFNSPMGACEKCRGFGRTIGVDYDLVVPDDTKTLAEGVIKPWQTASYHECQEDMIRFARKRGIPTTRPWHRLTDAQRQWVLEGEGNWEDRKWYGVKRFFDWLETKSYRMHIRVLLSKYRGYQVCPACRGARLKPDALLWRLGPGKGCTIRDVMLFSLDRCYKFFSHLQLQTPLDEAAELLLNEICSRLRYLVDVGLGYLTLDRQSRTLSGGEVQRINLTTALGTSLVNALFVLDEPSIGLHPRDIDRLIAVLHRLRDAGNTLIVVEHDPDVIRAADRILDLGPGPGERGGRIVFYGRLKGLLRCRRSLTAQYLSGMSVIPDKGIRTAAHPDDGCLEILGASEHNLESIDVRIPLKRLVCITGVSGSGKSTLVQDICYNALRKLQNKPVDQPGRHRAVRGHDQIDDVILVDQSPIGKTARSNPASYVGGLQAIRRLFSMQPLARERRYTPGTFSFNTGNGRCAKCRGNGFERVEMQFLSDVYIRCPDCAGRRYRPEVLEVKLSSGPAIKSIADVLDMTVAEACAFFADHPEVTRPLAPLQAVGLGYMRIGQPSPTLSGGEAQRLKLAGHLAQMPRRACRGHNLFLFDEPTTGLHFDDIAKFLHALRELIRSGHSVVVIEHNLEVIGASDWVIDLGPEGGEKGGQIVCTGTPSDVVKCTQSRTGKALRRYERTIRLAGRRASAAAASRKHKSKGTTIQRSRSPSAKPGAVQICNAREHNLKGIDVRIPRGRFTVVTGISGSGKSTLAFDILFAEGQRRYLESLNAYARQFIQPAAKPEVDAIFGIPPTVAIEQRTSRGGPKSTVATMTEIHHFLRLLFAKLGTQYCPACDIPIRPQSRDSIVAKIMSRYRGRRVTVLAPLVTARKGYYTDLAAWASRKGYSHLRVDGELKPTGAWPRLDRFKEHNIDLPVGEITVTPTCESLLGDTLDLALGFGREIVRIMTVVARTRASIATSVFSTQRACPRCGRSFEELDPRLFSFNSKHGWCGRCHGTAVKTEQSPEDDMHALTLPDDWWDNSKYRCSVCNGARLRPEALAVRFRDRSIANFGDLSVEAAHTAFRSLKLRGREADVARDILPELCSRLLFLKEVGLPYLVLSRPAPTLSGGEAQRIRLASQLGANLRGVCYILDEPTIGLHARDNLMLLNTLHKLRSKGNTVVVVEHDEQTVRHAEHVIDLGPGAGVNGGNLVCQGSVRQIMKNRRSVTGRLLCEPLRHPLVEGRAPESYGARKKPVSPVLDITGARLHNLKNLRVRIPLRRLVCVTGVSGSGKSTLLRDVLYVTLSRMVAQRRLRPSRRLPVKLRGCRRILGSESIRRVLEVDQSPIGKTPRSCPATYVGFWTDVRRLFAGTSEARMRGYGAGRFSFNLDGGRCDACAGQGVKKIEMSFLPDVSVTCEVCAGARFTPETLSARFRNKTIADILAMSVDEAAEFFVAQPSISHPLTLLQNVGLGYLTLGQPSPTLSGGEAQRIKLVTELARVKMPVTIEDRRVSKKNPDRAAPYHALYVMDEPTIGLHTADVKNLIRVLHRLVDAGHTVVIIEHNMDIIAEADWIIDLGPEGGDAGGYIVAEGTPRDVAQNGKGSHTAKFLRAFLRRVRP